MAVVSSSDVSAVAQDYLKVIWSEQEWSPGKVTSKVLAARLAVTPATVSATLARLRDQELVHHAPYGAIELTDRGRLLALAMVRRHRLIETYLVEALGYSWDEVHREAEVLEHAVSDLLVERIDRHLGHPRRDPHGDRIPTADGEIDVVSAHRLTEMGRGTTAVVVRIADADSATLRHLSSLGITLDETLTVVEPLEHAGVVLVTVASGDERVTLGTPAAAAVWVSPVGG